MNVFVSVVLIFTLSFVLAKSTNIVIKNVTRLAKRFSIPEFAIGFFILGFATSLPEIFVAINAAIKDMPGELGFMKLWRKVKKSEIW